MISTVDREISTGRVIHVKNSPPDSSSVSNIPVATVNYNLTTVKLLISQAFCSVRTSSAIPASDRPNEL